MPLPDFTSPTLFPPFTSLPTTTTTTPSPNEPPPSSSTPQQQQEGEYHLLAQIHHNMTLTKPTLICTDHTNTSFAVVFNSRPASGPDTLDLSRLGYRRGATLVLPRARRTPPKEGDGSRGFVGITREEEGAVRVVPTTAGGKMVDKEGEGGDGMGMGAGGTEGVERVLRVGRWLRERDAEREGGKVGRGCESCGGETRKDGGGEGEKAALMKCTGCGEVEYCCKVSFIMVWLGIRDVADTMVRSAKPRDGTRAGTRRTARSSRLFAPFGHDGSRHAYTKPTGASPRRHEELNIREQQNSSRPP